MWIYDVWLPLIDSLEAARPEEYKIWDKIFPDQMHKVVQKQPGKLEGHESAKKWDPFDAIHLCKLLAIFFCGCVIQ